MYTKEEAKQIREEFWEGFRRYTLPRKRKKRVPPGWIMDKTGINALALHFSMENGSAMVCIDIETASMDKRIELFEKVESLRKLLHEAMGKEMNWELDYIRENGKSISRIYTLLPNVSIYERGCWGDIYSFFYKDMLKLEAFFEEYRDYLKYS